MLTPFAVLDLAGHVDGALQVVGPFGRDGELDLAVVNEQVVTDFGGGDDFGVWELDARVVALGGVEIQAKGLPEFEELAVGVGKFAELCVCVCDSKNARCGNGRKERSVSLLCRTSSSSNDAFLVHPQGKKQTKLWTTHAQLGALQVPQNGNRMRVLFFHLANGHEQFLLLLLRTVGKVETKDVGARQKELLNHFPAGRGRSERRHLLGGFAPPLGDHGGGGDRRRGQSGRHHGAAGILVGDDRHEPSGIAVEIGEDEEVRVVPKGT